MNTAIVFTLVAIILFYLMARLMYHAHRSEGSEPKEHDLNVALHARYGKKLFAFTVSLCLILPLLVLFYKDEEIASAPRELELASRLISVVLIFIVFPLLVTRKRTRMGTVLHDFIGSVALLSLLSLAIIGAVMYFKMYWP